MRVPSSFVTNNYFPLPLCASQVKSGLLFWGQIVTKFFLSIRHTEEIPAIWIDTAITTETEAEAEARRLKMIEAHLCSTITVKKKILLISLAYHVLFLYFIQTHTVHQEDEKLELAESQVSIGWALRTPKKYHIPT